MMLLIRPRPSPTSIRRRGQKKLRPDALVHLILAPLYGLVAWAVSKGMADMSFFKFLKEALFWLSLAALVFMALPRFGERMQNKRPDSSE